MNPTRPRPGCGGWPRRSGCAPWRWWRRRGSATSGQALSAAEQYAAVYGAAYRPGTDRVVCSPGHYVIAAYAAAAETGLLDEAALASYGQNGSSLEAIGTERSPVPEYTCGSLGQGLSAAAGFALGDRLTGRDDARTFAFISDGELQEGQVWEAAMFAGHHRLSRLTVLLDANNSQVDGPVDSITTIEPVAAKWQAFGWDAADLDGHDVAAIAAALAAGARAARPQVLICRTSTRHGLACLPPDADGHFIKLPADLAGAAAAELRAELGSPRRRPAMADLTRHAVLGPPYRTVLKPYGRALVELARARPEVVCLSGDLTRQCEVDLFQEEFPGRFIHAGMAEANMIGVAGALARQGLMPFVHSFGVFTTRRPLDQIVNAVAYPRLPVRIVGFMPGVSSPGGPSHQAIEDIALMRAIPGMTVIDVADATETAQVVAAMADVPGPVYLRLKRGEIPVIFPGDHRLSLDRAQVLEWRGEATAGGAQTTGGAGTDGGGVSAGGGVSSGGAGISDGGWSSGAAPSSDVALLVSGMMVAPALAAARVLRAAGAVTVVVNVPVIKPLDTATVLAVATASTAVVTAENHTIIGGLGSAVAEVLAESGLGRPLRRIGLQDTFAEGAKDAQYLFTKYGLTTQHIVDTAWSVLDRPGPTPRSPTLPADVGEYAPV